MALDLGELTIALEVENNLGRGLAEAKREVSSLSPHVQQEMNKVVAEMDRAGKAGGLALGNGLVRDASGRLRNARGQFASDAEIALAGLSPAAERKGTEAGGVIAQGMRSGLIRNSPLIVAAAAGALAAGAPLMATAATGLFAGVGIVAAAQSEQVQSAWMGTWRSIRDGAISEARPIEAVLVQMAGRVGAAFDQMRPQLQGAFTSAAPQIAVFTDGVLALANNALPGLVRAVQQGMPITEGFADFLAKIGTGMSDFFDRITQHAPAAGAVWSQLGDTFATLLPLLGELLGQGAELAANVLPLLNGALGATLAVVEALGPALPLVAAGLGAWKAVGLIAPMFDKLATSLAATAAQGGLFAGTAGRMSGAMSGLSAAAGPLAIGIGAWAAIFAHSESQIRKWTAALNEGGDAARQAKEDMSGFDENMGRVGTVLDTTAAKLNIFTASTAWAFSLLKDDTDEAREAHEEYLASLTPGEAAARNVAIAQRELADAIGDHGANSPQAQAAQENLTAAERVASDVADEHARAIKGVTEALQEQADQSRAAVDANFAYQDSLNNLEDAHTGVLEAINEFGIGSEEASRATLQFQEALAASARAAGELAMSELPASLDDTQKAAFGAKAELDELNRLAAQFPLSPELEEHRRRLEGIAAGADTTKVALAGLTTTFSELGYSVNSLPDGKTIRIDGIDAADIDPMRERLRDLGFTVTTTPDGKSIDIQARTEEAQANIGAVRQVLVDLGLMPPPVVTPQVDPAPAVAGAGVAGAAVDALHQKRADPIADLANDPLIGGVLESQGLLDNLATRAPLPTADLYDDPLVQAALNDVGLLGNLAGQTPTPVASLNDSPLTGTVANDMGQLLNLAAQHAIPMSSLNDGSLVGTYLNDMGLLGSLSGQRPTPITSLNDGPFQGTANSVENRMRIMAGQRPTPIVQIWDWATGPIQGIKSWLDRLQNKTITVTTVEQRISGGATVNSLGFASGGYTGHGGKYEPAGVVHRGEFVFTKEQTQAAGVGNLAALARSLRGYAGGGEVASINGATTAAPARVVGQPVRGGSNYQIELHMHGVDFAKAQDRRRVLAEIRSGLRELDRELT